MLIKLHVVRYRDSHEDVDEEVINMGHVVRMAPCDIPDSLAKTYLFFPEQPMWQQIKVTESIDDILKVSNKADYRELAYIVGRGVRLLREKEESNKNQDLTDYDCCYGCKYQKTVPIECEPCCKCSRICDDFYKEETHE